MSVEWPNPVASRPTATRLLGLRVRTPPGVCVCLLWVFFFFSGRGLCVGLITRPEESYRMCVCVCVCVSECDREASIMIRPWPTGGCCTMKRRNNVLNNYSVNVISPNSSQKFKLKPRREYVIKLSFCYTDVVRWTQCAVWSLSLSAGNRIHALMLISQLRGRGTEH